MRHTTTTLKRFWTRVFFLALAGNLLGTPELCAEKIRRIEVAGNMRLDASLVTSHLPIKVGDTFSEHALEKALLKLFATKLFADVHARFDTGVLVITVSENKVINQIAFEGNEHVSDKEIRPALTLAPRNTYTQDAIRQTVQTLRQLYSARGYFTVRITPQLIERDHGRVDIVFTIQEGPQARVAHISFIGNTAFTDSALKGVIFTHEKRWWRFFANDDTYIPENTQVDQELLRRFYHARGYPDFKVSSASAKLSPDKQRFFLTYVVDEGKPYTFSEPTLDIKLADVKTDLADIKADALRPAILIEKGKPFNQQHIEDSVDQLVRTLGKMGTFVEVVPHTTQDPKTQTIAVRFDIKSAKPVYVDRIAISGNTRTRDHVIRREVAVAEGDPLHAHQIDLSRRHLLNLDFFKEASVEVNSNPANPSQKNLDIKVEEKSTGELGGAAGLSTADGPLLEFTAAERNFRGKAQEVELRATLARRRRSVFLSFTEPYFMNRRMAAGFDVFYEQTHQSTQGTDGKIFQGNKKGYTQRDFGGSTRLGYQISRTLNQRWRYALARQDFTRQTQSVFLQKDAKRAVISTAGHDITWDKRDNPIEPTNGGYLSLNTDLAGLGGAVRYLANQLNVGYYHALDTDNQYVARLRGRYGVIFGWGGRDLRVADRYMLGGASVRGFDDFGIGPRDNQTQDAIGGRQTFFVNAEISTPLGSKSFGVKGYIFSDWGCVWSSGEGKGPFAAQLDSDDFSLRGSVGIGVRWQSPFGMIGCSLAKVLKSIKGVDKTQVFRFSLGTDF